MAAIFYFTEERTIYHKTELQQDIVKSFHDHMAPTMQYDNTIGGQDYEPLSKTMYKEVELVNNLKLTDYQ